MADNILGNLLESNIFDYFLRYLMQSLYFPTLISVKYDFLNVFQKVCEDIPWENFTDCSGENILSAIRNLNLPPEPANGHVDRLIKELAALKIRMTSHRYKATENLDAQKEHAKRLEEKLKKECDKIRESERAREELENSKRGARDTCKKQEKKLEEKDNGLRESQAARARLEKLKRETHDTWKKLGGLLGEIMK
jgi:Rad3-related DNA helicase